MYIFVFAAIVFANLIILFLYYIFLILEEKLYYNKKRKLKYKMKTRYRELCRNKRKFNR